MSTKIFVNLAVRDLDRSIDFFTRVGFPFDKRFTDENAACLVISDDIYAMLLTAFAAGGQPGYSDDGREFMYIRSFQDPDGHLWEIFHLDPSATR